MKTDWDAWAARDLGDEDIVRLILDGTVVKARIDRKATSVSLLVAVGVRRDGQKVLLGLRNMGGESTAAWTAFLADMSGRASRRPILSSSTVPPGSRPPLPPAGPTCRSSAAPFTSTGTCWPMRRGACTTS